jgi:hypothetical protein
MNTTLEDQGFLGRWSLRKAAVREGKPVPEPVVETPAVQLQNQVIQKNETAAQAAPVLTLDDVKALTKESDFSGFVAKGIDPSVSNAAMKKLFTDPHYNIMDGLDTYIDDYSTHAPLPQSVLEQIVKGGFLNMFHPEKADEENVAKVENNTTKVASDDNLDLQLQRDDATGREDARPEGVHALVPPPSA